MMKISMKECYIGTYKVGRSCYTEKSHLVVWNHANRKPKPNKQYSRAHNVKNSGWIKKEEQIFVQHFLPSSHQLNSLSGNQKQQQ